MPIFANTPCKSTCLYSLHLVCTLLKFVSASLLHLGKSHCHMPCVVWGQLARCLVQLAPVHPQKDCKICRSNTDDNLGIVLPHLPVGNKFLRFCLV